MYLRLRLIRLFCAAPGTRHVGDDRARCRASKRLLALRRRCRGPGVGLARADARATKGPYDEGQHALHRRGASSAGRRCTGTSGACTRRGRPGFSPGAFRVFGATLGVERAVKLAVVALAAVLVFLLARRAARPGWAAAAALTLRRPADADALAEVARHRSRLRSRDAPRRLACRRGGLGRARCFAGLLAGADGLLQAGFRPGGGRVGGAVALLGAPGASCSRAQPGGEADALHRNSPSLRRRPRRRPRRPSPITLAAHGTLKEFFEQAILFPRDVVRALPLASPRPCASSSSRAP